MSACLQRNKIAWFSTCILCIFNVYYLLFVPTNAHVHIKILDNITNAPTCFGASAPSSGSFDIVFAEVMKY